MIPTPDDVAAALAVLEAWNDSDIGTPEPAGVSEALQVVIAFAEHTPERRRELVRAMIPVRPAELVAGLCVFCGCDHAGDCPRH